MSALISQAITEYKHKTVGISVIFWVAIAMMSMKAVQRAKSVNFSGFIDLIQSCSIAAALMCSQEGSLRHSRMNSIAVVSPIQAATLFLAAKEELMKVFKVMSMQYLKFGGQLTVTLIFIHCAICYIHPSMPSSAQQVVQSMINPQIYSSCGRSNLVSRVYLRMVYITYFEGSSWNHSDIKVSSCMKQKLFQPSLSRMHNSQVRSYSMFDESAKK